MRLGQRNTVVPFLKKFSLFLLLTPFLVLAVFFGWQWLISPVLPNTAKQNKFVVKRGEDLSTISQHLEKEGLIKNALVFKVLVLSQKLSRSIQGGSFEISPSLSTPEIIALLVKSPQDIWITFPEGWRKEQFSQRLATSLGGFDYQEFLDLVKDTEGYLFPDTYLFPRESSPSAVIKVLANNFERKFSPELEREAERKDLTQKQVVILASIIERETRYDQDRPIVAGILLKRWQNNWPLQADATIQYAIANSGISSGQALEDWWPVVKKEDLMIDSPYNTYTHKGLPPGPICNPGLATIKAVVYSQQTPYWFYLSDKDGQTHYAATIEEHNRNITKFLLK